MVFSKRGPTLARLHQHVPWSSSLSSTFPASFEHFSQLPPLKASQPLDLSTSKLPKCFRTLFSPSRG